MANISLTPEYNASKNSTPRTTARFAREQRRPEEDLADTRAGWTDEKGQARVAMAERMRAAAGMDDMRRELMGTAMEDEMSKKIMEQEKLTGPVAPTGLYEAAASTVEMEGRKDKDGNLAVYELPSGDYGGSYEVAGINNKFHPEMAEQLKNMAPPERRPAAAAYIVEYTSPLTSKLPEPYRPFFQDLAFNRGMGGATRFLQRALGVPDDGALGPKTLAALEGKDPTEVMKGVSVEQWAYEKSLAARDPSRNKFLPGLQNRIVNRFRLFGSQPSARQPLGTPFSGGAGQVPTGRTPAGDIFDELGRVVPA